MFGCKVGAHAEFTNNKLLCNLKVLNPPLRLRAGYGVQVQSGINVDKAASVAHSQSQNIAFSSFQMAQQYVPVHLVGVQQDIRSEERRVG